MVCMAVCFTQAAFAGSGNEEFKSVNHKGYNTLAPENTLPAFELSAQKGYQYVETDISFTKDGVPVLLHNSNIKSMIANGEEKNKYWTFSATFRGRKLESDAILDLYMMDGSTRSETMSVVKEKSLANGDTEQTFACTFYLDQAGDHIFDPALVPVGYDVDYSFAPKAIPWGKEHIDYLIAKADDSAKKRQQIVSKDDEDIPICTKASPASLGIYEKAEEGE